MQGDGSGRQKSLFIFKTTSTCGGAERVATPLSGPNEGYCSLNEKSNLRAEEEVVCFADFSIQKLRRTAVD
jgi:hypothetical protein